MIVYTEKSGECGKMLNLVYDMMLNIKSQTTSSSSSNEQKNEHAKIIENNISGDDIKSDENKLMSEFCNNLISQNLIITVQPAMSDNLIFLITLESKNNGSKPNKRILHTSSSSSSSSSNNDTNSTFGCSNNND
jgi:hypothetical protein